MEHVGQIWSHVHQRNILEFKGLFWGYWDSKTFMGLDFSLHKKGIPFEYILADSWFTCEQVVKTISVTMKKHFIGIAKIGNILYSYEDK